VLNERLGDFEEFARRVEDSVGGWPELPGNGDLD
jgi:hypothetical protein